MKTLAMRILFIVLMLALAGCSAAPAPAASATAAEPTSTPLPTATATVEPSPTATLKPTASPTPMPDMPEGPFTYAGQERPLLMAHYMPWYQSFAVSGSWGWHWTMNHFTPKKNDDGSWSDFASNYTPLVGLYDSTDERVLEYQVQLMKLSGIDGVIVDWYGIESYYDYGFVNSATQKLFEVIKKAGLKFVVCYEDQTILHMVDGGYLKKEEAIAHGQKVMRYLQDTWFKDEAYLKQDGQPVLFIFGPQYFKEGPQWDELFSVLEPKPLFVALDNVFYKPVTAAYPWPPMWASVGGVLSHDKLLSYLDEFYDKAEHWPYRVGGAFPGFNDIYKEAGVSAGYGYLDALEGKTFRFTLQKALDQQPDLVQLITWNDYGEGTNIEPTVEYGYLYLEMVQEARKASGDAAFAFTADDLRLPQRLFDLRKQLQGDTAAEAELDQASAALLNGDAAAAREILQKYP